MIQGSAEWFEARRGFLGASGINDALATTKTGGEAATRRNLRAKLIAERLTGICEEGYTNTAMQWGIDHEPIARALYEAATGNEVEQVGFILHPELKMTGASPDGLVSHNGLVEIKCPNTATHIDYLLGGNPPAQYHNQMLWQMECTGRDWCDFASYDPRMPEELQLFIVRFGRDNDRLGIIRQGVIKFLDEINDTLEKLALIRDMKGSK